MGIDEGSSIVLQYSREIIVAIKNKWVDKGTWVMVYYKPINKEALLYPEDGKRAQIKSY